MNTNCEPIIGLEIHVELKTKSKMFCGCAADWFGKPPNTLCCPVCLGLPGALPVPNKKAVEWCIMLGLALHCEISEVSKFDRKNYFYPDLPKGYQISQYDQPIAKNGHLVIPNEASAESRNLTQPNIGRDEIPPRPESDSVGRDDKKTKTIRIRRVHMEEDTGKLMHTTVNGEKCTLIDFNRSGVPLIEIVTEPDIHSSEEAKAFLKKLHQIIRYLDISVADMEKGSMRLEPNISVRLCHPDQAKRVEGSSTTAYLSSQMSKIPRLPSVARNDKGKILQDLPDYKVEVKNINSFNFVKKAIDYEIVRHTEILGNGELPKQETRGWDEKKGITYSQRSKEEAHDYRYFPEPDIPPMRFSKDQIRRISTQVPELPDMKKIRYINTFGLSEYDATILVGEKGVAEYFEKVVGCGLWVVGKKEEKIATKTIANWIINRRFDITKTSPEELVKLIQQKQQIPHMDEKELDVILKKVLENNLKAISDYRSGKINVIMYLVGQVMKETKGKADSVHVKNLLENLLQ